MTSRTAPSAIGSHSEIETKFLKEQGIDSLDPLKPLARDIDSESPVPKLPKSATNPPAESVPPKVEKDDFDVSSPPQELNPSDVLYPFLTTRITRNNRKRDSTYYPSSFMLSYMTHLINDELVDNFYFKRSCPEYHPYILRLYFGVIFVIQTLRAMNEVGRLKSDSFEFLDRFLSAHKLESLSIPGPMLALFKTICISDAEIPNYGKIVPILPDPLGPAARRDMLVLSPQNYLIPSVPGAMALLTSLDAQVNGATPAFPKKRWVPVDGITPVTFNGHAYDASANWSDAEAWSLVLPLLEYPCEASKKLNEDFAERISDFEFPTLAANDDLRSVAAFLHMSTNMTWFSRVKEVAAAASIYTKGFGTLADCSPSGLSANHAIVDYPAPATMPTKPTKMADTASVGPFSYKLRSSDRTLPEMSELSAAFAQTNISMYDTHPYLNAVSDANMRAGPYWSIRPQDVSSIDDDSYLALKSIVKKLMLSKV